MLLASLYETFNNKGSEARETHISVIRVSTIWN
jgi:hypothetical protein